MIQGIFLHILKEEFVLKPAYAKFFILFKTCIPVMVSNSFGVRDPN